MLNRPQPEYSIARPARPALGLGMLTVLLVVVVGFLPEGGMLRTAVDGLLDLLVPGLGAMGFVLLFSLAAMMLLGHLGSRIMPDT